MAKWWQRRTLTAAGKICMHVSPERERVDDVAEPWRLRFGRSIASPNDRTFALASPPPVLGVSTVSASIGAGVAGVLAMAIVGGVAWWLKPDGEPYSG